MIPQKNTLQLRIRKVVNGVSRERHFQLERELEVSSFKPVDYSNRKKK